MIIVLDTNESIKIKCVDKNETVTLINSCGALKGVVFDVKEQPTNTQETKINVSQQE